MIPKDLQYTKDYEWVKVEKGAVLVGITDFAQNALGDITFVELPPVGKSVQQFAELGVVESIKAAADIYAPLSGEVIEVNPLLEESPELINKEPYGQGWVCKLGNINTAELKGLLSPEEFEELIKEAGK